MSLMTDGQSDVQLPSSHTCALTVKAPPVSSSGLCAMRTQSLLPSNVNAPPKRPAVVHPLVSVLAKFSNVPA